MSMCMYVSKGTKIDNGSYIMYCMRLVGTMYKETRTHVARDKNNSISSRTDDAKHIPK